MRCYQCGKTNKKVVKCSGCGAAFKKTKVLFAFELDSETVQEYRECCEEDEFEYAKIISKYKGMAKSVNVPDGVIGIGEAAFFECRSLEQIIIPNGVMSIGDRAFSNCSSLVRIVIPVSLMNIGDRVFEDCYNLREIKYGGSKKEWQQLTKKIQLGNLSDVRIKCNDSEIGISLNIDNTLFKVSNGVLEKIYVVKNGYLEVQDGVTGIGDKACWYCNRIKEVTLPSSVTSIGELAFYGCSDLRKIKLPKSVISVGKSAFMGCNNLNEIYYEGTKEEWSKLIKNIDIGVRAQTKIHCKG